MSMITALQKQKLEEEARYKNVGFSIRPIGIGDGIQFTSLPENFFRSTGQRLIDVSKPWYLDHNPYVIRNESPKKTTELWNYPKIYDYPHVRDSVYMSNAEIHASVMGLSYPALIRPKLYKYEEFPYEERETILFHPFGKSHGALPDFVIDHVLHKYRDCDLYQVGLPHERSLGIPTIFTPNIWDLVQAISQCKMFIGVDSGPAWIAACYPDVVVKKVRTVFQFGYCEPKDWIALDVKNPHSFWDDRIFKIYNCFDFDCGFTESYKKI